MAWFVRIDRYGSVHLVRSQDTVMKGGADSSNSCGIASIIMVNFKMKKHLLVAGVAAGAGMSASPIAGSYVGGQLASTAIAQALKTEPEVYKIYTAITGSVYDGSSYSDAMNFPAVLRKLSLGDWECVNVGQNGMFDALVAATADGSPVIVHCAWNDGGAHFMVVDETHTTIGSSVCVCDPWDGELRLVSGKSGAVVEYNPNGFVWSFSVGGNRHEYDAPSPGKFSGWIVRRR